MNAPFSVRTKLLVAALSLLVASGFGLICNLEPETAREFIWFRMGAFLLAGIIAVQGVFFRARLQLLWGWGLAFYTAFGLVVLAFGLAKGPDLLWLAASMTIAPIGAYILLVDSAVKDYRKDIQ